MNSILVTATHESENLYAEISVDCELYFEAEDRSVGVRSSTSADGYEMSEVTVYIDEVEWSSTCPDEMATAVAFLTVAGVNCDALIETACEEGASDFDPRDYD
jgi:hypothetical protein